MRFVGCSTEYPLGKTTVTSENCSRKHPVRVSGNCPKGIQKIKKPSFKKSQLGLVRTA